MLAKEGYEVTVIALRPRAKPTGFNRARVPVKQLPLTLRRGSKARYAYQYGLFLLMSSMVLLRLHLAERISLVHVHSLPDFEVLCALPLRPWRVPVILDLHEALPEILEARFSRSRSGVSSRMAKIAEKLSCTLASHVITANDGIREAVVSRGLARVRVTTVYTPPETEIELDMVGDEIGHLELPDGRYLVYAGGVNRERDLETYILAVSQLANELNVCLVIAGEGEPDYLRRLQVVSKESGIEPHVRFVGKISPAAVRKLISRSEVGVVTLVENALTQIAWPNRIPEFAFAGKPLIVPDLRFIRQMVGTDAAYYTPGNPDSLARQLRDILTRPERRTAATQGSRHLSDQLMAQNSQARLNEIYRKVMKASKANAGGT